MKKNFSRPTWMRTAAVMISVVVAVFAIVSCRANFGSGSGDEGFLDTGNTQSHFKAFQVDPRSEDSAGPQFVSAADLDGDGLMDLVSAWNQSQPVQLHLQRRSMFGAISFETITLAGNEPTVVVSGLSLGDFDLDGRVDIAVLVKRAGGLSSGGCLTQQPGVDADAGICDNGDTCSISAQDCPGESRCKATQPVNGALIIYLGPDDPATVSQALAWEEVAVSAAFLTGSGAGTDTPEIDGYTSMAAGDLDGDGDIDIVAAWNTECGSNEVLVFTNLGGARVRDGVWTVESMPNFFGRETEVKDVKLADIDRDGDLDIVATRPTSEALNLHWYRNPAIDVPDDFHIVNGEWQEGTIAQIATSADIVRLGDIDRDGITDVVVRSTTGRVVQWLKGPEGPTTSPLRGIPWQVFTLAEFTDRAPEAIALGDLNFDGQLEVIISAEGGLAWFDSKAAPSVYDQWIENLIIDDRPASDGSSNPATTDPNVNPTEVSASSFINSVLVVDLDGDGANDLVATLDRSGLSGLSNDALVWFQNTLRPAG